MLCQHEMEEERLVCHRITFKGYEMKECDHGCVDQRLGHGIGHSSQECMLP